MSDRNRIDPANVTERHSQLQQGSGQRVKKPLNRISTWQMLDNCASPLEHPPLPLRLADICEFDSQL